MSMNVFSLLPNYLWYSGLQLTLQNFLPRTLLFQPSYFMMLILLRTYFYGIKCKHTFIMIIFALSIGFTVLEQFSVYHCIHVRPVIMIKFNKLTPTCLHVDKISNLFTTGEQRLNSIFSSFNSEFKSN